MQGLNSDNEPRWFAVRRLSAVIPADPANVSRMTQILHSTVVDSKHLVVLNRWEFPSVNKQSAWCMVGTVFLQQSATLTVIQRSDEL